MKVWKFCKLLVCLFCVTTCLADDNIEVYKNGVLHRFIRTGNPKVDDFTQNIFHHWENDTFEVFEQVKDSESIAIDLGAWIGSTTIWLSKNFYHVISVDADRESLECIKQNLKASECFNVTLCEFPVSNFSQTVFFGTRGNQLNESISYIKTTQDKDSDYLVKSITFKQLIYDFVYSNDTINSHKIGFIKCDIEGGEEDILEDLLYFAYNNKCKVYVSFHLDWWKSKQIGDFAYLFKYFNTNCPISDVCKYLTETPFASLLFEPLDAGVLTKNDMPALIIAYNQFTFIRDMVEQLEKYTSDITIVDNASDYQPLLDFYKNDFKHTLLRQRANQGYTVYKNHFVQNLMGNVYLLTDPDLKFNPQLPDNFIQTLFDISTYFHSPRVGFALCIDAIDLRTDINFLRVEKAFWINKLIYPPNPSLELYQAPIDTTFCLVNKLSEDWDIGDIGNHIRVAGNFTCFHRPWHQGFQKQLAPGEYESYLRNNDSDSSHYFKLRE